MALEEMRQWDALLGKALNESAKQALIPSPVNVGQGFSVGLIIAASLTSLVLNSAVIAGIVILKGRCVSGFDVLVISQLIINILLTIFVEPWDIIAYLILDNGWPFGETFCYLTRFLSLCLPFMSSWNIAMIAVHQFVSLAFLNNKRLPRSIDVSARTMRLLILAIPTTIIWTVGPLIHAPVVYNTATEIAHHTFSTLHVTMCTLEFVYDLLHSALGVFVFPFVCGLLCLVGILILHRVKSKDIPYVLETTVGATVSFQQGQTQGIEGSTLDLGGFFESDTQPIVDGQRTQNGVLANAPDLLKSSRTTTNSLQWPEIAWETQLIMTGLFGLFALFTGPSGILALYADGRIKSHGIHSLAHVTQVTVIFSLLPLVQLVLEPVLVLVISTEIRGVLTDRRRGQNVQEAAAVLQATNGVAHIS